MTLLTEPIAGNSEHEHNEIAQCARELWTQSGEPEGHDDAIWLEAERRWVLLQRGLGADSRPVAPVRLGLPQELTAPGVVRANASVSPESTDALSMVRGSPPVTARAGLLNKHRVADAIPHILIVDDRSCDGWIWAAALRRAGFRLSIAADTDEGWNSLEGRSFTLVITSQDATGRTGMDLIEKVRTYSARLPCILICDKKHPEPEAVARLLQPGALLSKPVTVQQLLAAVRDLLRTEGKIVAASAATPAVVSGPPSYA